MLGLLERGIVLEAELSRAQETMPSPLGKEHITALRERYDAWYRECFDFLPEDLWSRFEQQYLDRDQNHRIRTFLVEPIATYQLSGVILGLDWGKGSPSWSHPFEKTFRVPFRQQLAILRVALKRLEQSSGAQGLTVSPRSQVGSDLRHSVALALRDQYSVNDIDQLFLSVGAEDEWWIEPKKSYSSSRVAQTHGWFEGLSLHVPEREAELARAVSQLLVDNPALYDASRNAIEAALSKLDLALGPTVGVDPSDRLAATRRLDKSAIFIAHGGHKAWIELVLYLTERWDAEVVYFEKEDRTAQQISAVLQQMVERSSVALILMTGEDSTDKGALRARQNVVHEAGLFQAKLGFDKVALLRPADVEKYSNADGLVYLPFDPSNVRSCLHDLGRFLKRHGVREKE